MKIIFPDVTLIVTVIAVNIFLLASVSTHSDEGDLILTQVEKTAMEKFKSLVWNHLTEPFMKSEFYLIRWLRKAELDIEQAKQMLLTTVAWREGHNISNILLEDWSDLQEEFPMIYDGHDKQGRPLFFLNLGEWDLRAAIFQGKAKRLQRYLTSSLEQGMREVFRAQLAQLNGNRVTRLVSIIDSEGLNFQQQGCSDCLTILIKWAMEKENFYPSFTFETILLNVSGVGNFVLNAVRSVMSKEMRNDVKGFPANKHLWMSYLDQRIDKDQRIPRYGGTKAG